MFGTHLSRLGSVHRLGLVHKAIGILRKYGTNAHVYLPGVGTISGITAGNYLDSAGTTAASVDNPVGLSLDALQAMTLGLNVVVNGDFATDSVWSKGPQTTIAGGEATIASTGAASTLAQSGILDSTKTYLATFDATVRSGTAKLENGAGGTYLLIDSTKSYSCCFTGSAGVAFNRVTACDIDIDNVVFREIPGVHARQATTANKPILRLNSGKYSWQFDGSNDYLSLGAPLFQMSDDHCVIAGANCTDASAERDLLLPGYVAGTWVSYLYVELTTGKLVASWSGTGLATLKTASSIVGSNFVASARAVGNTRIGRLNGVQFGANTSSITASAFTTAYIGSYNAGTFPFVGSIYPVIAIKGTVSDADLLTLERFVGQLSGVLI